ncbi:hypothetical protein H5410_037385 [Solanum commersonii]|uniref:Uncharacterized protein n=1 Tax=Solanum commersonii TaxID=4109 RepID=A0A9J5Y701_SOLCO|nr:hypothetical protein H5410_037385 [Solanum commersonii]
MVRERKKKEITKQVVTPTRTKNENLGYSQGMEMNQGKEPMEQWPPLPSKEVTPKLVVALEVSNQSPIWVVEIKQNRAKLNQLSFKGGFCEMIHRGS